MMLSRAWMLLLFMALVFATASAKPKKNRRFDRHTEEHQVSKAEILKNREQRRRQLELMILNTRQQLADHSAGTKKLTSQEKEDLEKRIDLFQRKADDLAKEMDDREWDLVLRREQRHAERRSRHRHRHIEL